MAGTHQRSNRNWFVNDDNGEVTTWDQVSVAVLMDIRHELQRLNNVFQCANFLAIPAKLDRIDTNTRKKRRRRAARR